MEKSFKAYTRRPKYQDPTLDPSSARNRKEGEKELVMEKEDDELYYIGSKGYCRMC